MNTWDALLKKLKPYVQTWTAPKFYPLTSELSSTDWDGDSYSSVAVWTKLDLSVLFGVPEGARAVSMRVVARDSGSSGGDRYIIFSPAASAAFACRLNRRVDDSYEDVQGICPCDANGDIYYKIVASGVLTFDATIQIWGYWL